MKHYEHYDTYQVSALVMQAVGAAGLRAAKDDWRGDI